MTTPAPDDLKFDALVYGQGGGVMFELTVEAPSAPDALAKVQDQFRGYPRAAHVGVWAVDRKSGHAQGAI